MRTAETTTHEITADDLDESLHIEDSKVDDVLENRMPNGGIADR